MVAGMCRHCGVKPVQKSRGLCWQCYYEPGVRDLYPVGSANPATAKYANRGLSLKELEGSVPRVRRKSICDLIAEEMRAVDEEIRRRLLGLAPLLR